MKVVVVCEGSTEAALRSAIRDYVHNKSKGRARVGVRVRSLDGAVVRRKLASVVAYELADRDVVGVVAVTDVYPNFQNAAVAKSSLMSQVGREHHPQFRAHVAQHDLEAWLIPFWDEIAKYLRVDAKSPGARAEEINGVRPPSLRISELYRKAGRKYRKPIDGPTWLTGERLEHAAKSCPELKLFLDSLLEFAGVGSMPAE